MKTLIKNFIAWIDRELLPTYCVKMDSTDASGNYWKTFELADKDGIFLTHSYLKALSFAKKKKLITGNWKVYVSRFDLEKEIEQ